MSKILERVMYSQLYAFLQENNLITEQQHEFTTLHTSDHSTELATLKLTDTIMCELDNSQLPIVIVINLSQALIL